MAEQTCPCCGANLRISCNTAHPEHDCYHPDGHERPQPDWADLREMARGAGYQVHLRYGGTKARRKRYVPSWIWHVRDEHAAVVEFERTVAAYRVETRGTKGWTVLADPTPAEVLVAARLVGLGGAS